MSDNKTVLTSTLKAWAPLAVVIVIFAGLIYATAQQNYRQNANDPQIQLARDVADAILQGTPADAIVPQVGNTDLKKSLSPFLIIFDASGKPLGSSAILNGQNPEYPIGMLEEAKKTGEHRATWQPEPGVRIAAVVVHYSDKDQSGYVVAGRSLTEIEARVAKIAALVAMASAAALIISLLLIFIFKKLCKNCLPQHHQHTEITIDSTKEV